MNYSEKVIKVIEKDRKSGLVENENVHLCRSVLHSRARIRVRAMAESAECGCLGPGTAQMSNVNNACWRITHKSLHSMSSRALAPFLHLRIILFLKSSMT